ncbi:ABC transporter permease [Pollutibacter soli]|uniref:ABC transporter permease n=1 Tax=Pollutibacter soli TaxID=3034157 RepID=UPI003013305B
MFKNYIKVAIKNIVRHKAFSFINIAGLAIGMACSIFILIWVQNETSYDKFNINRKEIYRVVANAGDFKVAINPAPMAPEILEKLPGVKNFVRLTNPSTDVFKVGDRRFEEKRVFYADSTLLQVFTYHLVKGDPKTALNRPDAILISESMAKKYFGGEDALGKVLLKNAKENVLITGILKDIPANSHLQFDFIMPMSAIAQTNRDLREKTWDNFDFFAYLQMDKSFKSDKAGIADFNGRMTRLYQEHIPAKDIPAEFQLQPLTDIHLHSKFQADLSGHGNIQYVNIFFIVAIFIIIVACINFMNLSTARSARRAKEVGLRKVVGARRRQLISQFLGESMLITFVALLIAIGLVFLLMPAFNNLAGKKLAVNLFDTKMILSLVGIAILTGLIAGSYPAFFLSGFQPAMVLKSNMKKMGGNLVFRNSLVVVQFVVSIVLLAGTMIVYRQLNYIKNMNLGFDKSNLVYVPMSGEIWSKQQAFKAALTSNPLTSNFAVTNNLPANLSSGTLSVEWEGKNPNDKTIFPTMHVDPGFFDVFGMKLLNGRGFSKEFSADTFNLVLNETAVKKMGMTTANAVGKSVKLWDHTGTVIGVVKDFHYKPVQNVIEPLLIGFNSWGGTVVIRTHPGKTEATLKALEKITTQINPQYPFSYGFIDQDLNRQYSGEQQMGSLFNVFATLAIFISCLGLYGLSAFMAEQRTKEIGVRKVLGASIYNVIYLLSTGFTRLIFLAMLIAVPLAWIAMNSWLKGFAYRVNPNWKAFVAASVTSLLIAWLTVSFESLKAAMARPAKSLRTE